MLASRYSIGLDFANKSLGVVVVNIQNGHIAGQMAREYELGDPAEWLSILSAACRRTIYAANISADQVVGMGACFAPCAVVRARGDGTPIGAFRYELGDSERQPWTPTAAQSELQLHAGDWLIWQLTSGPFPKCLTKELVLSKCLSGFSATDKAVASVGPGQCAGLLTEMAAKQVGLKAGTPVSAASFATSAVVPGCGVASPSTMVMILGDHSHLLLNSRIDRTISGVSGPVENGILPGYFGYQIDLPEVGAEIDQLVKSTGLSREELEHRATLLEPGGQNSGACPQQLYRAMIESTAFEVKRIVESFRDTGVPCRRFCATGNLATISPLLLQIYADVLDARIHLPESDQPALLGAAILGCLAAGQPLTGHASLSQTIHAMARWREDLVYRPDLKTRKKYLKLYEGLKPA